MKPWERYQQAAAPEAPQGPWSKYKGVAEVDTVEDVMHPDISVGTRAVYKNFSVDPEAGFNYLQKQNPGLNFKKDKDGEVLAKRPEEMTWKKLDPSGFDLQDISDVGYDVFSGIGEGVATAAGGLLGAPLGPGALGTAALAGSATGAGLETLRQGIGQGLGVADDFSGGDIAMSGAFGAVSPLLFGTGAAARGITKAGLKAGIKQGATQTAEQAAEQIAKSQRGLFGMGRDVVRGKIAPFVGESLSGIDRDVLKWASAPENMAKIRAAEGALGSVTVFDDLSSSILDKAVQAKRATGDALGEELEKLPGKFDVDARALFSEFNQLHKKYENAALARNASPNDFKNLAYLESVMDEAIPEHLRKTDAASIKKLGRKIDTLASGEQPFEKKTVKQLEEMANDLDFLEAGKMSAAEAHKFKNSLNDASGIKKLVDPKLNLASTKKSSVENEWEALAKRTAQKLSDKVSLISNDQGGSLKEVLNQYSGNIKDLELVKKLFADPEKAERSLRSIITGGGLSKRKSVGQLSQRLGVPIDDAAKEAVAIATLAKGSPLAISSKGATSTMKTGVAAGAGSLAGYYLGNQVGGGYGGGLLGGGIGAGVGAVMGGPTAMKQYMRMNNAVNRGAKAFQGLAPGMTKLPVNTGQLGINVWRKMHNDRSGK